MKVHKLIAISAFSILGLELIASQDSPQFSGEPVFPLHHQHNHAPGIVECPNGDLLVSWYRGSGEKTADDVAVFGARRRQGQKEWGQPFVMADTPGFPDCNTVLFIDGQDRLWLFWPVILANTWQSCITTYRFATQYVGEGPPKWSWQGQVLIKPANFVQAMEKG